MRNIKIATLTLFVTLNAFAAGTFECKGNNGLILIKGQVGSEEPLITELKLGVITKSREEMKGTKITLNNKRLSFKSDNVVDGTIQLKTVGFPMNNYIIFGGLLIVKAAIESSNVAYPVECKASY